MSKTVGVSVLFTDLVGSTALGARLGAAETERIRVMHFGVLREAVAANGGEEVKNLGDGLMAVFSGGSAALTAAVAMQQAIHRHNRDDAVEPLAIRIGVATGDCTEDDGDYFGEPVIQAARLCARADAGEILASAVFRLLVPRDVYELIDVGELELKGLPEPLATLRVGWTAPTEEVIQRPPLQSRLMVEHLAPLVGREAERQVLEDAFKAASQGERRVVLLTGEAGLGKTRLAAEFAYEAFEASALVLYGRCDEELAVPYLPWVELLSHYVEHAADEDLAALNETSRAQLSRLLPGVAVRLTTPGGPAGGERSSTDQYALIDAVSRLLDSAAARAPTVVVLDDLHWADEASLLLLRHVASSLPTARLLIIGTYRDTDLGPEDALTDTSARLHRVVGVQRIALDGLSGDEVVALLEGVAGHAIDERGVALAHSLRADSAGNPFFVTELLRHLAESGGIEQGADGQWTTTSELEDMALPQSVRDVVGQRVRRLGSETRAVLMAAAVAGREFDGPVVARAIELGEEHVLDVLEEAMAAGLIAEVPGVADRFTFTHALVQHTLYDEFSESRRARMHQRMAIAIEQIVGDDPGGRVGELAQHWFAAVRPSELERAISYAIQAGDAALASSAPDEAVRWYARALEAIEDPNGELGCEVQLKLGDAERRAGRETFRQRLLGAAHLAESLHRDDLVVDAAIHNYRGLHSVSGEIDLERVTVLESALRGSGGTDQANRARLLATLAGELTYSDDERRFDLSREAMTLARSLGDDHVLLDVLERLGSTWSVPDMLVERDHHTAEAMELTRSRHDPVRRFFALDRRAQVLLEMADIDGVRACSLERRTIADQLGEPTLQWLATTGAALLDWLAGDIEGATTGAGDSLNLALETGQPDATVYFGALMLALQWHNGRFAETVPLIEQAITDNPGLPTYRPLLAVFQASAGRIDDAARVVADLTAERFPFPYDLVWLTSNVIAAEAASLVGNREAAAMLYDRLAPFADQVAASRATCQGPVSYVLGLLATTLGRDDAEHHLLDALERSERLDSPFHHTRAALALAELWREADPGRAGDLVAEARKAVERYGIHAYSDHVRAFAG